MIIGVVVAAALLTFDPISPPAVPGRDPAHNTTQVPGPIVIGEWKLTPSTWTQWICPEDDGDIPQLYMSPWLGFDHSMLLENNNGERFNFGGFDSVGLKNGPGVATSSNGHTLHYVALRHLAKHYDVYWENVTWIRFDNHDFQNGDTANGFDNVVLSVDEPWTAALVGLAGLLLLGISYKRFIARHY